MIPAQWASCVLPGEQAQRVAIERGFDPPSPFSPVLGQRGVIRGRSALDQGVPDDVGPGELDEVGAAVPVSEHPSVASELVEPAEIAGGDPLPRLDLVATAA